MSQAAVLAILLCDHCPLVAKVQAMKRLLTVLIALLAALGVAGPPASAETSVEAEATVNVNLNEILDLLTYRVHTVFVEPDGRITERTTNALVGLPTAVNVNSGLLPDLTVEILPLPPNRILVTYRRLPTAPAAMPLLAEVLVDVPGDVGARFGFDTREGGDMPPVFKTDFTFGIAGLGKDIDVVARTQQPESTPTLAVVGEVFTKGKKGAKLNPTTARIDLTPVPGELHATVNASGDRIKPNLDVTLESDVRSKAEVDVSTVDGAVRQSVNGTIDKVPDSVQVGVQGDKGDPATKADDQQDVVYRASQPIGSLDADLKQSIEGTVDGHIAAELTKIPTSIDVNVRGTKTTFTAPDALDNALVGYNRTDDDPLPEDLQLPEEPLVVQTELDSLADKLDPLREAVIHVPGVTSFEVDTGDPIVADLESAGGKLRALVTDTRESGRFQVDALVNAMPADARVELSKTAGTLKYDADAAIESIHAVIDEPDGFIAAGEGGAAPTHLDVTVEGIPGAVDLAFAPPDDDADDDGVADPPQDTDGDGDLTDEGKNLLARFDADGQTIGSISALLTSGPDTPFQALPAQVIEPGKFTPSTVSDGVIVEDSAGKFVVQAHISGLREVEVVSGGPKQNRRGFANAQRIAVADVDVASEELFLARLRRDTPNDDRVDAKALFSNLAPDMHLDLFGIVGDVQCDGSFKEMRCLPGKDTDNDGFIDEIQCDTVQFGQVCTPPEEADGNDLVDTDGDGFAAFDCVSVLVFAPDLCLASDPDLNGIIDDADLGVEADYTAGGEIDYVQVVVDPGEKSHPFIGTVQDVPTAVSACFSQTEACARVSDGTREGFVFDFDANAPVTFNAGLCLRPATQDCSGSADQLSISRMKVEDLSFEFDSKDEDNPLTVVLDTENKPVTGRMTLDKGKLNLEAELSDVDGDGDSGIRGNFNSALVDALFFAKPLPDGLIADRVKLVKEGLKITNKGGRIACPEDFSAEINASFFLLRPLDVILFELIGLTTLSADLTDELCGTE